MKKLILSLATLIIFTSTFAQQKLLNFGFEELEENFPKSWTTFGSAEAKIYPDFKIKKEGKNAIVIQSEVEGDFKALALTLPNNYNGKEIILSGYIKTENVTDGFAGLWMRIDPDVSFDNMQNIGLKGTNDWKNYEIKLKMNPSKTDAIILGALLGGKGKIWVDDLKITIDGKDISQAKIFEKKIEKADLDKEFDSGSKLTRVDKYNAENLKTLGLIWGFLKYYHPNISTGDYNWDYELFRILPKILNVSSKERDQILVNWIKTFGTFPISEKKVPTENVKIKPDLDWISNSYFSKDLTSILKNIKIAKRKDSNYYIEFFKNTGNPNFKNEKSYEEMKYPDEGFRLLTLFRYWNMIQYYFPYKNLIEEDWKNVLLEFIPKFVNNKNETDYALTTLELIARIHDTHATIYNYNASLQTYFGKNLIPAEIVFIDNKPIVKDFYDENLMKENELKIGDIILEINGIKINDIIKNYLKYLPASNYPTQLRNLSYSLLKSNKDVLSVKVDRNGVIKNIISKTYETKNIKFKDKNEGNYFKLLPQNVAYFYMGSIKSDNLNEVMQKIENTKGLVIDFRSYPSDFVVFKLGKLLKPKSTDFVKFSMTNQDFPGLFTFTSPINIPGTSDYYKGKIAILINESTQSSAEYHTMAFKTAPNAKIFGSTTAGADGDVSEINLPGGIQTKISGIGIYYPDGTETQRIGIVPDIEIKPTIKGIKSGKDEVLEKAIDWIIK